MEARSEGHDTISDEFAEVPQTDEQTDVRVVLFNNLQAAKAKAVLIGQQLAAERDPNPNVYGNPDYIAALGDIREAEIAIYGFHAQRR